MLNKYILIGFILSILKGAHSATVTVIDDTNDTIVVLPSMSSSFGPSLFNIKFLGHLWFTTPLNACSTVEAPPTFNSSLSIIGLIRRNECSFVEKVVNAWKAGFKAVLVFDPNFDGLITMSGSSGSVFISSFFIGRSSKEFLSKYLGAKYMIQLEDRFPSSFGLLFIPFIIRILLCLIFVIVFLLMRYASGLMERWKQRLSRSVLKLLALKKFKKGDAYEMCAVCLEDFKINDKLRILPCSHAYHQDCIDPWLTESKRTCPLCNKSILGTGPEGMDDFLQSPNELTPLIISQSSSPTSAGLADHMPSTSHDPNLTEFPFEVESRPDQVPISNVEL